MEDYGTVVIKLKELLQRKKVTRTALARETGLRYEIISQYYKGTAKRIDLITIAKICHRLNCGISDIIEYIEK